MSKYIFLFRSGMDMQNASPEALQANLMKWKTGMDGITAHGKLISGEPLNYGDGKLLSGRAKKMTDGQYAEVKEVVGGCLVLDAVDLSEAAELGKGIHDLRERW